jgi:hypothetical protein
LDVNRGAAGGYRLQLELSLLDGAAPGTVTPPKTVDVPRPADAPKRVDTASADRPADPAPARKAIAVEPEIVAESLESVQPPAQAAELAPTLETAPPATVSVDDALQILLTAWPSIVERIGRNPANRPLIAACRPVEVRESTVVLGFPESQAFLRDIAERKRSLLEEGIGDVLGRVVVVRLVASNVELAEPVATFANSSDDLVEHARRVFGDDVREVAEVD